MKLTKINYSDFLVYFLKQSSLTILINLMNLNVLFKYKP